MRETGDKVMNKESTQYNDSEIHPFTLIILNGYGKQFKISEYGIRYL